MRTYDFDKHYFDEIDSKEKAYWLGFLWANSCVFRRVTSSDQKEKCIVVHISQRASEREHLEKFLKAIRGNQPILDKVSVTPNGNTSDMVFVDINSMYFAGKLYDYGLVEATHRSKPNVKLTKELKSSFILGYFDGNGCITSYHKERVNPTVSVIISGNKEMLTLIRKHLENSSVIAYNDKCDHLTGPTKRHHCMYLRYASRKDVVSLYDYFYNKCDVCKSSKYKKFSDLLNISYNQNLI